MCNDYIIVYNPPTYNIMNLMDHISTPLDIISYLTKSNISQINKDNFIDFLYFDEQKHRKGMIETLGIECYSAIYIANQIRKSIQNFDIYLCDQIRKNIGEIISVKGFYPKGVFITAMSSNFPTAVAVSIILNYAKIPVIIGGIHVSTSQEDVNIFIRKYCPYPEIVSQVVGPGDSNVIKNIVTDLISKRLSPNYLGETSIENGVWGATDVYSLPPMKLYLLKRIPIIGKLLLKIIRINPITPYLGCPYSCNFCSISTVPKKQRKFTTRTADDFIEEIMSFQKKGINFLNRFFFFLPDNLLLGGKLLHEILDKLISSEVKINYAAQISIDIASDKELLKKMRLSGATHFFIGLESLDIRNLEYIGKHVVKYIKKSGLTIEEYYRKQIKIIQDFGISVHASFILGLPYDIFKSKYNHTGLSIAEFCVKNHIGLQPCSLTDLPGSINFQQSQKNQQYLYGKQGTLNYLVSLCVTDLTEPNRIPPDSLYNSPLLVFYMAYEEVHKAANTPTALMNGLFMFYKSFLYPTKNGRNSLKERIIDSIWAFASQISVSQYIDHGEMISYSLNGITGTVERLYDIESNMGIKHMLKDFVYKFFR